MLRKSNHKFVSISLPFLALILGIASLHGIRTQVFHIY